MLNSGRGQGKTTARNANQEKTKTGIRPKWYPVNKNFSKYNKHNNLMNAFLLPFRLKMYFRNLFSCSRIKVRILPPTNQHDLVCFLILKVQLISMDFLMWPYVLNVYYSQSLWELLDLWRCVEVWVLSLIIDVIQMQILP